MIAGKERKRAPEAGNAGGPWQVEQVESAEELGRGEDGASDRSQRREGPVSVAQQDPGRLLEKANGGKMRGQTSEETTHRGGRGEQSAAKDCSKRVVSLMTGMFPSYRCVCDRT